MKNWRLKAVLAAIAVAGTLTLTVACGGGSGPTESSNLPDTPAASASAPVSTPAPASATTPEGCNQALRATRSFKVEGKVLAMTVKNSLDQDCGAVSLGTYLVVDPSVPDKDGQELVDQDNHPNLKAGEEVTLRADLPKCGEWQGDGVQTLTMPFRPSWSPGYHIGHDRGAAGVCEPPKGECIPARVDISLSEQEGLSAQSVTASVVAPGQSYSFTVNATNGATVVVDFGDGSPTESVTGPFPKNISHTFAFGSTDREYTVTASVIAGKYCAGKDEVKVKVRAYTCRDFAQGGPITGDIGVDTQPTVVNFSAGTVGPAGGSFANETLPASKARPDYGQTTGSFSTTYTLPYRPAEGLNCPLDKTFSKPVPPKEPTCEQANPPSHTASGTFANYTLGSTIYRQYWRMNQGNDNARQNACVNRGGVWLNDYNIPDDGTGSQRPDVCRFDFSSPPAGAPGADMTLYDPPGTVTIVTQPDGVKVTGTATFNNAGNWRVEMYATGQGGPWVKDFKEVTLQCGQSSTKNVSYSCENCHEDSDFFVRVFRNGVQQPPSPYPLN